jgi:hypothetical protein
MNKIITALAFFMIGLVSCSDDQSTKLDAPTYTSLIAINGNYHQTSKYVERRNKAIIEILEKKLTESNISRIAAKPSYDRAIVLDQYADTLCKKIDSIKVFLIAKAYDISIKSADTLNIPDLGMGKSIEVSDTYMVTNPQDNAHSKGLAHDIKILIGKYRQKLMFFVAPQDTTGLWINLNTPDHFDQIEARKVTWECWYFYHRPLLGLLANLNGLESNIRIAENAVLNQQFIYYLQNEVLLNKHDSIGH